MKSKNLTVREDWIQYWKEKSIEKVERFPFQMFLPEQVLQNEGSQILEIGGFPGALSAALLQEVPKSTLTILDLIILEDKVRDTEKLYGLGDHSIDTMEGDMFDLSPEARFDLVCSFGLIEHFKDSRAVLDLHLKYCKPGAFVLITMPNFRGLNGFLQRLFHRENLKKHNLDVMSITRIKGELSELNASNYEVTYHGMPMLWLEPDAQVPGWVRKLIDIVSVRLKRFRNLKGKMWSPFIVVSFFKSEH